MGDTTLHAFHQRVLILALAVHVITAWFSSGYYAADEHYQVIDFAQARLDEIPISKLAWEYAAHIRSALLPSICYAVFKAAHAVGLHNPFHLALLLRALTAIVALWVVRRFVSSAQHMVDERFQRAFVLLSYFLWFVPYQHVRFSSETWSGLLFLLGLSGLLGKSAGRWTILVAGLCFGFSAQLKPAMGIACAGALAWALSNGGAKGVWLPRLLLGLVAAIGLGFLVDAWFYGACTPTLWNYALMAVHGDPAHPFEIFPWYSYLPWTIKYGIWPIGALLVAALLWLTYRAPRSLLVWCIWPYLILISAVPHKEVRFLFPLADLAPLLLVLALQALSENRIGQLMRRTAIIVPLVVINVCGLLVSSTTAAGSGRTRLAEQLWRGASDQRTSIGYAFYDDLIWKARIPAFYLPATVEDIGACELCAISVDSLAEHAPDLFVSAEPDFASKTCVPDRMGYSKVAASEPDWTSLPLMLYNPDRPRRLILYARDPATSRPSEP